MSPEQKALADELYARTVAKDVKERGDFEQVMKDLVKRGYFELGADGVYRIPADAKTFKETKAEASKAVKGNGKR